MGFRSGIFITFPKTSPNLEKFSAFSNATTDSSSNALKLWPYKSKIICGVFPNRSAITLSGILCGLKEKLKIFLIVAYSETS
jgi:hypothetical protein